MKRPSPQEAQELAHNLGALFLNFGVLEHTLSLTLAAAFGLNDLQERTFVRGMFARSKVQLLQAYAKEHWNTQYQAILKVLATKTLDLIEYRNDFAHGTIMHDADGKWSVITFRGGDRFSGKAEPIDPNVLKRRLSDAHEYSERFQAIADATAAGRTAKTPSSAPPPLSK